MYLEMFLLLLEFVPIAIGIAEDGAVTALCSVIVSQSALIAYLCTKEKEG